MSVFKSINNLMNLIAFNSCFTSFDTFMMSSMLLLAFLCNPIRLRVKTPSRAAVEEGDSRSMGGFLDKFSGVVRMCGSFLFEIVFKTIVFIFASASNVKLIFKSIIRFFYLCERQLWHKSAKFIGGRDRITSSPTLSCFWKSDR